MPLAVLTFLVGISYVYGLPSDTTVGRWIVFGIASGVLLLRKPITMSVGHWLWLGLLLWIAVGFTWAVSRWDHFGGALQWAVMAVAFCLAAESEDLTPAWLGLAAAISVSAVFSVFQYFGFQPVSAIDTGTGGAVGLFLSKNATSEISVLAFLGAIGVATRRTWWLAIGPAVSIYLVGARTSWTALAVAFVVASFLVARRPDRPMLALLYVLAGSLAAVVAYSTGSHAFYMTDRLQIWGHVIPYLYPWGDGLGSFAVAFTWLEFAHNEFIQYGFELGAGSLLVWGIVGYAFGARPILERSMLAAFLAQCVVWWPLHGPATAMVFALLAGRLCGDRRRARAAELNRGESRERGAGQDAALYGAGSLSTADLGRFDLPFRSQPAMDR